MIERGKKKRKKRKTKKEVYPKDRTGRIYKRTKEDEKVAKELNNI